MLDHRRTDIAARLAMYLDLGSGVPLHRQIVDRVWVEVMTGTLDTGARLPTVRQLAIDLGIHPNTVGRAYEELELLGVLATRAGEGTVVCLAEPDRSELERRARLDRLARDAATQAEALGVSLDQLIEVLATLRASARDAGAPESTP